MLAVLMYKVNWAVALNSSETGMPTASPTTLAKNGNIKIAFAASLTLSNFNASNVPLPGPELDAMVK
eukprot:2919295-Ditylum_brightwellii.AAC.1